MKTDKEIVAAIRAASAQLKRFYTSGVDVPASSKTTRALDAIADAFEANPPLAEVEADAIYDIAADGFQVEVYLWLKDAPRCGFPVTVTIRKRELEAV